MPACASSTTWSRQTVCGQGYQATAEILNEFDLPLAIRTTVDLAIRVSVGRPAAVRYHHDCVHRNGIDKSGTRLMVFTKEYVQETADLMRAFVDRIERGVHGEPPF